MEQYKKWIKQYHDEKGMEQYKNIEEVNQANNKKWIKQYHENRWFEQYHDIKEVNIAIPWWEGNGAI